LRFPTFEPAYHSSLPCQRKKYNRVVEILAKATANGPFHLKSIALCVIKRKVFRAAFFGGSPAFSDARLNKYEPYFWSSFRFHVIGAFDLGGGSQ
jgi:hypothetical protein